MDHDEEDTLFLGGAVGAALPPAADELPALPPADAAPPPAIGAGEAEFWDEALAGPPGEDELADYFQSSERCVEADYREQDLDEQDLNEQDLNDEPEEVVFRDDVDAAPVRTLSLSEAELLIERIVTRKVPETERLRREPPPKPRQPLTINRGGRRLWPLGALAAAVAVTVAVAHDLRTAELPPSAPGPRVAASVDDQRRALLDRVLSSELKAFELASPDGLNDREGSSR